MSAISLAVIGKNNEPLYIKEFFDSESRSAEHFVSDEELFGLPPSMRTAVHCSPRQQFILHAALDRFEQLAGPHPGSAWRAAGVSGTDAMWVGLLYPIEDIRVYGTSHILCWMTRNMTPCFCLIVPKTYYTGLRICAYFH